MFRIVPMISLNEDTYICNVYTYYIIISLHSWLNRLIIELDSPVFQYFVSVNISDRVTAHRLPIWPFWRRRRWSPGIKYFFGEETQRFLHVLVSHKVCSLIKSLGDRRVGLQILRLYMHHRDYNYYHRSSQLISLSRNLINLIIIIFVFQISGCKTAPWFTMCALSPP